MNILPSPSWMEAVPSFKTSVITYQNIWHHNRHRLRVQENRALRRIFASEREEMTGGWRKRHNEELHGLYSSPNIIRVTRSRNMRWVGRIEGIGEMRNAYKFLPKKPEGKRPLGGPRSK
jgi:hypothetical protein